MKTDNKAITSTDFLIKLLSILFIVICTDPCPMKLMNLCIGTNN